jgi:hypothetical protein
MADKNKGGRPPKFNSADEFNKKIKHYFDTITKTDLAFRSVVVGYEDEEQKKPIYEQQPVLNNAGEQVSYTTYFEIPSITGLCQHVGITRDTWKAYESREEFIDSIKKAKDKIEKYNIEQLYRKDQVTGIIFNLKNNFGWADKQEIESSNLNRNIEIQLSPEDQALVMRTDLSTPEGQEVLRKMKEKYPGIV